MNVTIFYNDGTHEFYHGINRVNIVKGNLSINGIQDGNHYTYNFLLEEIKQIKVV